MVTPVFDVWANASEDQETPQEHEAPQGQEPPQGQEAPRGQETSRDQGVPEAQVAADPANRGDDRGPRTRDGETDAVRRRRLARENFRRQLYESDSEEESVQGEKVDLDLDSDVEPPWPTSKCRSTCSMTWKQLRLKSKARKKDIFLLRKAMREMRQMHRAKMAEMKKRLREHEARLGLNREQVW